MTKINHYNYESACPDVPTSCSSSFSLINRQHPIHGRISTNNERDRRPIDPPPIIQIRLNNATPQQTDTFHQNSYFFMCANLAHPTNDKEIYTPTHNALSGQSVSSMYKLKDIDNHDGAFFIFGDISVKVEGTFRLKLSLFEITSTGAVCLNKHVFTSPFTVYPAKNFPGMLDSTFLSRSFSDQGARIRIRKENRAQVTIATTTTTSSTSRKRKLEIETAVFPQEKRQSIPTALSPAHHPQYSPMGHTSTAPKISYYYHQAAQAALPTTPPSFSETTSSLSRTRSDACNNAPYYCERRASVRSSGTECSSSSSSTESTSNPSRTNFSSSSASSITSPGVVSVSPFSPPQQSYDKFFRTITTYSSIVTTPTNYDPTVKLPPLRHLVSFVNKKQQKRRTVTTSNNTTTEQDAILAMMQLSSSSPSTTFQSQRSY